MKTMQKVLLALTLAITMLGSGCWITAEPGTVQYQTIWQKPGDIVRPESGGMWTIFIVGDDYYPVNVSKQTTPNVKVQAQTKDNARLSIEVAATFHLTNTDEAIRGHIDDFKLDEKKRDENFMRVLIGHITTETRNVVADYDAYSLMSNQEVMRKTIEERLKLVVSNQLRHEIESVQIMTAPDFENDQIELAASQVVANQKLKQAADAAQEAAKVETETKKIQAQNFENPKIYALEMQKLRVEEAKAWAGHSGSLIFGGGNNPLMLDIGK